MGSDLDLLISDLQNGISKDAKYIQKIRDPKALVRNLVKLRSLVGNSKIKDAIAQQTSHLIREGGNRGNMLNTILYGPPGVGKTMIGIRLAHIWHSLGYISKPKKSENILDLLPKQGDDIFDSIIQVITLISISLYIVCCFVSVLKALGIRTGWILVIILVIVLAVLLYLASKEEEGEDPKIFSSPGLEKGEDQSEKSERRENRKSGKEIDDSKPEEGEKAVDEEEVRDDDIIAITSREDYVAEYVGWTDKKTKASLMKNRGKVIFIDEMYSLYQGPNDMYGAEACDVINRFASEHPSETVIIMAGYKDKMQNGPFKQQPGLPRRCMWHFECQEYTGLELYRIFNMQVGKDGWKIQRSRKIKDFFEKNREIFPNNGGDTDRLKFFAQTEHARGKSLSEELDRTLTYRDIVRGAKKLRNNNIHKDVTSDLTQNLMDMVRSLPKEI